MSERERREIDSLPEKYRPMSPWGYFWYEVLYNVPIVGLIFMILFALSGANIARRNHARSHFCIVVIAMIVILIVVIISAVTGGFAALTNR